MTASSLGLLSADTAGTVVGPRSLEAEHVHEKL